MPCPPLFAPQRSLARRAWLDDLGVGGHRCSQWCALGPHKSHDGEPTDFALALDHIALFCERGAKEELAALERAGFTGEFGRRHEGQGTANRQVLFEQNYLELIWIDEPEIAAPAGEASARERGLVWAGTSLCRGRRRAGR